MTYALLLIGFTVSAVGSAVLLALTKGTFEWLAIDIEYKIKRYKLKKEIEKKKDDQ